MDAARTHKTFTFLVAVAACAAMYGSMKQQALAERQGASTVASVSPSDFPAMPPALRAQVLRELERECGLSCGPVARATARDCYAALAVQAGEAAPGRPAGPDGT